MPGAPIHPQDSAFFEPVSNADCPCGSGQSYGACCAPYLDGSAWPETASALMRSRYTAYALGRYDWLVSTTHSSRREEVNAETLARQCQGVRWLKLELDKCQTASAAEEPDFVEFHAIYELEGVVRQLGERSAFLREAGKLYYVDGTSLAPLAYRRQEPKVGRNEPCPCGSGKKYKKCCGHASGAEQ